jgi:hypothetical protein
MLLLLFLSLPMVLLLLLVISATNRPYCIISSGDLPYILTETRAV